jgi:hypothetical protein
MLNEDKKLKLRQEKLQPLKQLKKPQTQNEDKKQK